MVEQASRGISRTQLHSRDCENDVSDGVDFSPLLSLFRFFLTHGLTRCHSFPLDSFVHFYEHLEAYCIWYMGMIIALIDDPGKAEI